MPTLVTVLNKLLTTGEIHFNFSAFPHREKSEESSLHSLLSSSFEEQILNVAGPALPYQHEITVEATEFLLRACWFLVHRGLSPQEIKAGLTVPRRPQTAAEHLSADVIYRFLAGVHRRAQAIDANDILTLKIEEVLRKYPLSGAMSSVSASPTTPVYFDQHPGLLMLYAERLVRQPRPEWIVTGAVREYIEFLFHKNGLDLSEEVA